MVVTGGQGDDRQIPINSRIASRADLLEEGDHRLGFRVKGLGRQGLEHLLDVL